MFTPRTEKGFVSMFEGWGVPKSFFLPPRPDAVVDFDFNFDFDDPSAVSGSDSQQNSASFTTTAKGKFGSIWTVCSNVSAKKTRVNLDRAFRPSEIALRLRGRNMKGCRSKLKRDSEVNIIAGSRGCPLAA